jgi:outer membrane receptor for Fe3+-dicitrate
MTCRRSAIAGLTCLLLLMATSAIAQTTGRIVGRVLDSTGAALPGVSVTVTSPSLQGAHTTTTDSEGNYRFPLLPPGTYAVKAELQGFKTVQQSNVEVGLDRTVEVALQLGVAGMAETVEVDAASPVVDTTTTTIGLTAKAEQLNRLPIQRDIYNVTRLAPGTTQDAVGPSVFGSTGAENQYIIEGLNVTGLAAGQERKNLNFDFVDSIEVKTGGLDAEYGRVTGGIVNVVTKSGGNAFHGSLFGFNSGGGLQSNDDTANDRPTDTTTVSKVDRQWDYGGTLGGYLAKDKLWFFGSYAHMFRRDQTTVIRFLSAPGSPAVGSEIPADNDVNTFAAKVTYKMGASHTVVGSINGDPGTRTGNVFVVRGPESTWKGTQDTGGPDGTVNYTGLLGSSFVVNGIYGRHYEKSKFGGPGASEAQLIDQTVTPNVATGGFTGFENDEYTRNYYAVKATKYLGGHELKGGIDWEDNKSVVDRYSGGGGDRIYKLRKADGTIYYRHRFFVNDLAPGFDRADPTSWTPAVPLTSKPDTLNTAFFARDSWKVMPNLTIDGGIRWERQQIKDRNNATVIDLTTNWAPRIGFIWDFAKNGRSKIYGSYGRYYESIPLDIDIRSFGGELGAFVYNFDPSQSNRIPDPAARKSSLFGGSTEPTDPNLRGQYLNEAMFGGEYEVAPNFSLSVKYVRRDLARVIEDFLVPSEGNYFVANPGEGTLGKEMAFYSGGTVAAPKATRVNDSVEFSARKHFSNNWQLLASYVWSKLEGNYDGTFQNSTGQLDPNINSAFDYADFLVNAQGKLSNDRVSQIKLDGSYEFSHGAMNGLNVALSTHWFSGTPLTAYGYSLAYANWEYYLTPRGSLGTGPSDFETDIHANYPIKFGGNNRLNIVMNVFNLFNRQSITQYDQRYNLIPDGPCAGIPDANCNGDGGLVTNPNSLTPVAQLANARATATNPDFLKKGVAFTLPRSVQIGVRFEF